MFGGLAFLDGLGDGVEHLEGLVFADVALLVLEVSGEEFLEL